MARYIGLDAHMASCTIAVVGPSGKRLAHHVVQTNGSSLVELIKTIQRPRYLCFEEGTHSAWLYELLSPHVNDTTVLGIRKSRGPKNDKIDAFGLADKLRTNSVETPVYKEPGPYGRLRELGRVHRMLVRDSARIQNRLRALFRSRGMATDDNLYNTSTRESILGQLPARFYTAAELLFHSYDAVEPIRREAERTMLLESRKHAICKILVGVPGLGPIRVAHLMPIIVTPHRFRTRSQLWKYVGLSVVTRSSSDWAFGKDGIQRRRNTMQTRGLNRNHNAVLKNIFKGAATTVIGRADKDCPVYQHYVAMLDAKIKPELAKVTIARQIAAITLAVWKKEEPYDRAKLNKKS